MLLDGKRILVTGVLNDASIAFSVARRAQEEGAEVVLTSFGRAMSLTRRAARRLPSEPQVVELDVTDAEHLDALAGTVGGQLDGVLHAVAFAPESCLGGGFLTAPWEDVSVALQISTYSLKALAVATLPLMGHGGSIVGLDFDNTQAWPVYDWMGVAKSAFESSARYLARRPRTERDPRQPRLRGSGPHDRGEEHSRVRAVRGGLVGARTARLGCQGSGTGRQGVRRAVLGPVSGDDGRDAPCRRRVPRHRCLSNAMVALARRPLRPDGALRYTRRSDR